MAGRSVTIGPSPQTSLRAITADERTRLERIAKASGERLDRVRRARALLAVADGQSFTAAGRQAGFRSRGTVTDLVRRFNRQGIAALTIATGRGRRPTYDANARAKMVATAQAQPERQQDGTATWSLGTLQRRLRRDGMMRVGTSAIRRVLQDAGSSYQRSRTWCPRVRRNGCARVASSR